MPQGIQNRSRLLLVDDDPSIVRLLTTIIQRSLGDQIEVHASTDPAEAMRCLENNLIDILITDLEMPGIDGLGLLRAAKRANALTQVLFITGHSTLDALSDALELGATDYLLKPLDQAELLDLLGQSLRRLLRWKQALAGTLAARAGRPPATSPAPLNAAPPAQPVA